MAFMQHGGMASLQVGFLDTAFRVFQRVIAAGCLIDGLRYWAMLIGYSHEGAYRFDLIEPHWQVAATSLAALLPVTAMGLWMAAPWGAVIWVMAAGAEVAMHLVLTDWFGPDLQLVAIHLSAALMYLAFRIALGVRPWLTSKLETRLQSRAAGAAR